MDAALLTSTRKPRTLVVTTALVVAIAAFFVLRAQRAPSFHGMALDAGDPIAGLTFAGENGPVSIESLRGKPTVVYFGYTQCPDVCPTTLSDVAKALRSIGADADAVQVVMITVDPQRDTPAHLARYVRIFDPHFVGLSGSEEQIADAAARFGVHYARQGDGASYSMEHTASLLLLDAAGRLRVILPYGMPAEQIADDLKTATKL
ncbi:MAG: SCO family protein [Chloroflexi bacterium]|nr:SCO family protein [Chloroflexota bacterium]